MHNLILQYIDCYLYNVLYNSVLCTLTNTMELYLTIHLMYCDYIVLWTTNHCMLTRHTLIHEKSKFGGEGEEKEKKLKCREL